MRRKHLVVFYGACAWSIVEWSVAAWGLVSAKALDRTAVVETQARHFPLGGGSTGTCREGLAALLGDMTSEVRFVILRARVALLHTEDIERCDVHRTVHRAALALPESQQRTASRLPCAQVR